MPERDIRIRLFIDDSNLKPLAAMTTLLQKAAAAEKTLERSSLRKNKAIQKQAQVVGKDNTALKNVEKSTRTWTQQIVKNIGKVAEWGIATGVVFGAIRTLRTAIDDIVDVEFAMAGLTKVMQDGGERAKVLRSELLQLGQQYGELGTAVIDASTEFARLQITNFEIAESTEAALLAQAIAEMEVVQASGFLIASMQQFEQTSLSNIRTLDQWNELSNRMAVRAIDLAQATARAGSVIHNAGDDMAFLNGMTAALVQATKRSGQEIGNAIRTFGTYTFRLRSVALLEKSGIKVRNEATGQLKSFADVISDTAIKWVLFTDVEKRAIAQAIAGTRRQNEFLTLMREYPEVLKATEIALNSFGSAQEESAILLDTAQKKAEQLRAGMQRMAAEFSNTKGIKILLDSLNALINAIIAARGFIVLLAGSLTLMALRSATAITVITKLRVALMGLAAAHPVLLALSVAAAAGIAIYAALNKEAEDFLKTMLDMAQASVGLAKAEEQRAKRLEDLIALYRSNAQALERASDPAKVKQITDTMGDLAKEIESAGQAADKAFRFDTSNAEASLTRATALIGVLKQSYDDLATSAREQIRENVTGTRRQVDAIEAYIKVLDEGGNRFDAWSAAIESFGGTALEAFDALKDTSLFVTNAFAAGKIDGGAKAADKALKELNATLAELEDQLSRLDIKAAFQDAIQDVIDLKKLLQELRVEMDANTEAARHYAAIAQFGGATQVDTLRIAGEAIKGNIALVQEHIATLAAQGEETGKLEKILDGLNQQLAVNKNRITEAGVARRKENLAEFIKLRTEEIKVLSDVAIQRAKDNGNLVKATELEIEALRDTKAAYQSGILLSDAFGLSTHELQLEVDAINRSIALQTQRLNEVIKPGETMRRVTDLWKESEATLNKRIEENNAIMERQISIMQSTGTAEETIARIRVNNAERNLALSKGYLRTIETEKELVNALKDAYAELDIAIRMRQFADTETGIQRLGEQIERQIELAKAWGATGVQAAQMRIEGIRAEGRAVVISSLTYKQKFAELLRLNEEMVDATHGLAVEEAKAATAATDAWIKEFERRADAWAKLLGKGLSRKGLFDTLERLQQEMVDRWIRSAFEPIINRLTKWEFQMLGISPEQLRIQEQNRNKVIIALRTGGNAVQSSIVTGANYHAAVIRAAMTNQPVPVIGGAQVSPVTIPGIHTNTGAVGPEGPLAAGGGFNFGAAGLALAPFILANAQDFATGRGGGVRAAGSVAGGIAGGILGGGNPAAIAFGAQIGNELVGALQGLKNAIFDDTEERRRPQAETLRQQVSSASNRGTFGNAASITYYNEINVNMQMLIPDREGARRAAAIIKKELHSIDSNVSIGA